MNNIKKNGRANILIVDDEIVIQKLFSDFLANSKFSLFCASNNQEAKDLLASEKIDIMLLDIYMGEDSGIDLIPEAKKISPETEIIVISGTSKITDVIETMRLGITDFLLKPIGKNELLKIIDRIIGSRNDYTILPEEDSVYIGESKVMRELVGRIKVIAPTNLNVLITGKSGTGKEVFAKQVYQYSKRANRPFVAVDCGAIPEELIENELFGNAKGESAGTARHKGKFELAYKGTILLDEITSLPLASQEKLIKAIQDKKFYPLESDKEVAVDFRIIATSSVDFEPLIKKGAFREDLFYHLNEVLIEIPELNERDEDFEGLALFFINKANKELNKKVSGITKASIKLLRAYHWKGNIREFKHVIFTATLYCLGTIIKPEHLTIKNDEFARSSIPNYDLGFHKLLKETEKSIILEALDRCNWNKSEVAKELRINRKTLYRKIAELNINEV